VESLLPYNSQSDTIVWQFTAFLLLRLYSSRLPEGYRFFNYGRGKKNPYIEHENKHIPLKVGQRELLHLKTLWGYNGYLKFKGQLSSIHTEDMSLSQFAAFSG
jgi:hypothetical protein